MKLTTSFTLGNFRCHLLEGGRQRLDGGAMFGVVPKPLWSKKIPPDERNRIPLTMRCLLVEHPDGLVLIDTALGDKEDPKFIDIYGVENAGNPGPTQLEDALRAAGHQPQDVRWVINTICILIMRGIPSGKRGEPVGPGGRSVGKLVGPTASSVQLAFPNATYIVKRTNSNSPATPRADARVI
jgi:hypothetical protein